MVVSMTGYGRTEVMLDNIQITIEVKTVNHRFLDVSIKMPRFLMFLEDRMKKKIQTFLKRGRVDVFITLEGEGTVDRKLQVDWGLMDQYIQALEKASTRYQLEKKVSLSTLLQIDGVFNVQEQEQGQDEMQQKILEALEQSLHQLQDMRIKEGLNLKNDVIGRLKQIKALGEKIEQRRDLVIEQYRTRILERIRDFIQEELKDDSRIYQEVALLAEKGDITEEITRLFSHIQQFENTLDAKDAIGRKLDFIVQEMHREVNTIGSKSSDVEISQLVVGLKSEVEKVKEQVQNIE
ncbi:YicC/YloC family endoribonuclease [Bacillaceae bacterium S4-13-58]